MAKKSKRTSAGRSSRIHKYINYVREAFFWPVHLASLGVFTLLAVAGLVLTPEMGLAADITFMLQAATVFTFGGLELMMLGTISKNPRFIRAINAKYSKDIDQYYKTKTLVDYYNALNHASQQRFDKLHKRVKEVKENYKKMTKTMPELVNKFIQKLNNVEHSYARLLYFQDKLPTISEKNALNAETQVEIDKLAQEINESSGKLRDIKEKRLKVLQMRVDNAGKVTENRAVIEEQLQTIEEMVEYISDQPITMQNTDREDLMIDNLLFETEQTQESLQEIENLMQSEFYPGMMEDYESENDSGYREKLRE